MADQHIVYNSRIFCTRWNGLEKGSIFDDALDDKEYEGNLIYLLKNKPMDRRMIVTLWCPEDLHDMSLPPCVYESLWDVTD